MSNTSPPDASPPLGPGSPRDVPPEPGSFPIDPATLPKPLRDEIAAPDPVAIDTASEELRDGANRCPNCGSTDVRQRPGTENLVCLYCRTEWSTARVEEEFGLGEGIDELVGTIVASGAQDIAEDAASLMSFKCSGCGAEVTVNTANAMTARCHWCRHVLGVNEQIPNGAVPDAVLPFHIKKEDAIARIRQFVDKRSFLALKQFKDEFTPENVLGVYLPYMVVDANAGGVVSGKGEVETRRYTETHNDKKITFYDADVYAVERQARFTVDDLPIEASAERGNLDTRTNTNNIINAILPFDTKNAVKWNASYLAGHSSEKRDVNVDQLKPVLDDQLLSILRAKVAPSVKRFDRGVRWEHEGIDVKGSRWVAMYLPVWLYSWHQPGPNGGLVHYVAVNGRTGETMGSVPVQHWKLLLVALTAGTFLEGIALMLM